MVAAYRRVLRNARADAPAGGRVRLVASATGCTWSPCSCCSTSVPQDPVLLGIVGAARVVPYMLLSVPAGIVADRFDRRTHPHRDRRRARRADARAGGARHRSRLGRAAVVARGHRGHLLQRLLRPGHRRLPAQPGRRRVGPGPGQHRLRHARQGHPHHRAGRRRHRRRRARTLSVAFVLNALTFAIVAVVLWTLPPSRRPRRQRTTERGEGECRAVPSVPLAGRGAPTLGLAVMDGASSFVFGGLSVLTVVIAYRPARVGEAGTGLLNSAVGVGGLGGLARGRCAGAAPPAGATAPAGCADPRRRRGRARHVTASWRVSAGHGCRLGGRAAARDRRPPRCSSASCPTRSAAVRWASWRPST